MATALPRLAPRIRFTLRPEAVSSDAHTHTHTHTPAGEAAKLHDDGAAHGDREADSRRPITDDAHGSRSAASDGASHAVSPADEQIHAHSHTHTHTHTCADMTAECAAVSDERHSGAASGDAAATAASFAPVDSADAFASSSQRPSPPEQDVAHTHTRTHTHTHEYDGDDAEGGVNESEDDAAGETDAESAAQAGGATGHLLSHLHSVLSSPNALAQVASLLAAVAAAQSHTHTHTLGGHAEMTSGVGSASGGIEQAAGEAHDPSTHARKRRRAASRDAGEHSDGNAPVARRRARGHPLRAGDARGPSGAAVDDTETSASDAEYTGKRDKPLTRDARLQGMFRLHMLRVPVKKKGSYGCVDSIGRFQRRSKPRVGSSAGHAGSNKAVSASQHARSLPMKLSEGPLFACPCCRKARRAALRAVERDTLILHGAILHAAISRSDAEDDPSLLSTLGSWWAPADGGAADSPTHAHDAVCTDDALRKRLAEDVLLRKFEIRWRPRGAGQQVANEDCGPVEKAGSLYALVCRAHESALCQQAVDRARRRRASATVGESQRRQSTRAATLAATGTETSEDETECTHTSEPLTPVYTSHCDAVAPADEEPPIVEHVSAACPPNAVCSSGAEASSIRKRRGKAEPSMPVATRGRPATLHILDCGLLIPMAEELRAPEDDELVPDHGAPPGIERLNTPGVETNDMACADGAPMCSHDMPQHGIEASSAAPGTKPRARRQRGAVVVSMFDEEAVLRHLLRIGYTAPVEAQEIDGRGRGVYARGFLPRGCFVMEYIGQLITGVEAERRDAQYRVGYFGSYMFYFEHNGRPHCVDATAERKEYGVARLMNHSRKAPNLTPRKVVVDGVPRLALVARRDIGYGEELLYDYGERDEAALREFTWLRSS